MAPQRVLAVPHSGAGAGITHTPPHFDVDNLWEGTSTALAMTAIEVSILDRIIDVAGGTEPVDEFERENRKTRRRRYHSWAALLQWTPDGQKSRALAVQCKDISSGGLGILSPAKLDVGQEAAIMILRSNGTPVLLGARVVHCRGVDERKHEAGLEFIGPLQGISFDDFRDENGALPQLVPVVAA